MDPSEEENSKRDGHQRSSARWKIRSMRPEDIEKCLIIWKEVELTEAHVTVRSSLETDPDGFYVAELVPSGEVIGMCAGVMTRADTAFMGFYAVEPKFQGMGIGRELWAKTTARLAAAEAGQSINIGLYGVPVMSEKYERSGFKVEDSITMLIYESDPNEGDLNDNQLSQLKDLSELKLVDEDCFTSAKYRLELIDGNTSEEIFNKLIDYDTQVNSFSRETLLKNYLWSSSSSAAAAASSLSSRETIPLTFAIVRDKPAADSHHQEFNNISLAQHQVIHGHNFGERKSSCCAKPSQESIIEDETLSTNLRSSLSISASNVTDDTYHQTTKASSPVAGDTSNRSKPIGNSSNNVEIIGYGCIRYDNTSGGILGPIYADSSDICQVLLKNLLKHFKLPPGGKYSIMSLSSNHEASRIMQSIGLIEMDQCSRMFTRFVPTASYEKIFYVHSPNFSLF